MKKASPAAHGFSLVELAVVFVLLSVLMGVLLDRGLYYRQQAEDMVFKANLVNMRTALRVRAVHLKSMGKRSEYMALEGVNPMSFLVQPPANYLGEKELIDVNSLPLGNWFFDTKSRQLIYLLNSGNSVAIEGQKSLNFKVKLLRVSKISLGNPEELDAYNVVLEEVVGD